MIDTVWPQEEYTVEISKTLFERGQIELLYKPVDANLTHIAYCVPVTPDFDINNLKAFADNWAPYDKWYTQKIILQHGDDLVGTNG